MWTPPFYIGQPASRLLGVDTNDPPPPTTSEFELNVSPGGLFAIGNAIGAVDTFNSRVLIFPPVEQWTPNTTYQAAVEVAGQPDFSSNSSNLGNPTAGPNGFSFPGAAAFFGSTLYVADSANNRVLVVPQNGATFGPATMVLGQDAMTLNAPNLVEGREFDFGGGNTAMTPASRSISPPALPIFTWPIRITTASSASTICARCSRERRRTWSSDSPTFNKCW